MRSSFVCLAFAAAFLSQAAAAGDDPKVARGKYIVTLAGCSDCHTPGVFSGTPDMARYLGGSDTGFALPGAGVFVGQNLTPDVETGIGSWSIAQIISALREGKRPDGTVLMGVMPWASFASLTDEDALAVATFLKSLPPVKNKIAGPFGPNDKPTVSVSATLTPNLYMGLPASAR